MQRIAPLELSEAWDNTGLLLGDPVAQVSQLMTCLTLTPDSVSEAIEGGAQMVIAHHPLPFKALAKITTETYAGGLLWRLATSGVSVYSPHTAWDSATHGINARLASLLSLKNCQPLVPADQTLWPGLGSGRIGELPQPLSLDDIARRLSDVLPDCRPRSVESLRRTIQTPGVSPKSVSLKSVSLKSVSLKSQPGMIHKVAICCGSGGSLLPAAVAAQCDLFVTGEGTFHTCLEAQAAETSLLMIGHFASERFALVQLAQELSEEYPGLTIWASQSEKDPVRNITQQA